MKSPGWHHALAVLAPAALVGPAAWRGLTPLGWDALPFFLPLLQHASRMVRQGELPVWTDAVGTGFPLLASVQVPVAYPPLWPLLLSQEPGRWLGAYLLFHLVVAALGGVALARAAGMGRVAAAAVGVLCGAGLPVAGIVNRPEFAAAAAWGPWILAAAFPRGRGGSAWVAGAALGLCAAVSPQLAAANMGVVALLALTSRRGPRVLAGAGPALAWAGALAAPTLVPFIELLPWTDRSTGVSASRQLVNAVAPDQWLQAFSPGLLELHPLGSLALLPDTAHWGVPYAQTQFLVSPFSGAVAAGLGIAGALAWRRLRPVAWACVALLALATPALVPGVAALWSLPPLSLVRFPAKAWLVAWPLAALLVGGGVAAVAAPARHARAPRAVLAILAGVLGALLAVPPGAWRAAVHGVDAIGNVAAPALALSLSLCALATVAALGMARPRAGIAVAVLVSAEALGWSTGAVGWVALPASEGAPVAQQIVASLPPPHRVTNFWHAGNPVLASSPSPSLPRAARAALEHRYGGGNAPVGQGAALEQAYTGIRLRGVHVVAETLANQLDRRAAALGSQGLLLGTGFPVPEGFHTVATWPEAGVSLLASDGDAPAVAVARRVLAVGSDDGLLRLLQDPGVDLREDAIVLEPVELPMAPHARLEVAAHSARLVDVRVDVNQDALLWTRDALGPGWGVSVDGVAASPVAVHGALRGVVVPAGNHRVTWEHSAASLWAGIAVAALCVAWLLVRRVRPAR